MIVIMEELLVEHRNGWTKLVLNRPEVKNALNTALLRGLADILTDLATHEECRAVMICGVGTDFAAGADISEIESKTSADGKLDPRKQYWAQIRGFPKPLVAAVDGFCLGGGFELALMADILVLGDTAKLGLPETNLGLIPGAGGAQRLLARIGRARASRMVMLGEIIDADTAELWGIASFKIAGSAIPEAENLCVKLATRAPLALMGVKKALIEGEEKSLAIETEREIFEALLNSADKREGIAAFRAKRKPEFKGR